MKLGDGFMCISSRLQEDKRTANSVCPSTQVTTAASFQVAADMSYSMQIESEHTLDHPTPYLAPGAVS